MNKTGIMPFEKELITISFQEIFPAAEQYFLKTAGLDKSNEKHNRMWTRALEIYEEMQAKWDINAVVYYMAPEKVRGRDIFFSGVIISCNGFEGLDYGLINGAYFYLITAGNAHTDSGQVIDQLYADIWGTSLVDAARDLIRDRIQSKDNEKGEGRFLSPSFGPGYYGMELSHTSAIFRIIDPSTVNVMLSPGGMMIPQKSVTGLYLSIKDKGMMPPASCESCIGGASGCAFCNQRDTKKHP
ncbi:hypothetical protein MASR2M70_20570 [Bacillota bacterium]